MNKPIRIVLYSLLSLFVIYLITTVAINSILKKKLESFIETRLPENFIQSYDDLSLHIINGTIAISNASVALKNKNDSLKHTFVQVEWLKISKFHHLDYLLNNQIHFESIQLENPQITYYKDRLYPSNDSVKNPLIKLHKPILIDRIIINNSNLIIYEGTEDSTSLSAKNVSLEITDLKLDNTILSKRLPVEYKEYSAKGDSIFVKTSNYENLTVRQFTLKDNKALFHDITLKTKYSKAQLSRIIKKERDYYNLTVDTLSVSGIDFGFNNTTFFGKSKQITLTSPTAEIYRDKLVVDDPKIKPLYSKTLRELPFQLMIDTFRIKNGSIIYSEKEKVNKPAGSINFSEIEATITNLGNTYKAPLKTELNIKAHFMEKTPLAVDWVFDVQNLQDQFIFKADIGSLQTERLNSFTEPNLNLRLSGVTNKIFFTIDGNNDGSTLDMKIRYTNFKAIVLNKRDKRKNKVLSSIVNTFISKNSQKKNDYYKEGTIEVTRDKTKSFFNYLWINVRQGLIKSVTGWNKLH